MTMVEGVARYPGGKNKVYHQVINLIPPHRIYIETHLGSGAVLRNKMPASISFGIDVDKTAIEQFGSTLYDVALIHGRAEDFLLSFPFTGEECVYCDPPYHPETRSRRRVYKYDYREEDHVALLKILSSLKARVIVSGYDHPQYNRCLGGWITRTFTGTSHAGRRQEKLWLNFRPGATHDNRYLGDSFRERQSIKRKRRRWKERFAKEPPAVRQAILEDLIREQIELSLSVGVTE